MPPAPTHGRVPAECRIPAPYSSPPPVGAADSNSLLMLAAHAQLGRREQPIDDVIILPHAIVDELPVTFGTDDEQRRRLSLGDTAGHLDIHFGPVIECRDGAPRRVVAFNCVTETQPRYIDTINDRRRGLGTGILASQRDQLIPRILPGYRGHIGLFCRAKLKKISAPVSVDDEVGDEIRSRGLDQDVNTFGRTCTTLGIADDPAHGIPCCDWSGADQLLTFL